MAIERVSQNDELRTVARKCDSNFRQLAALVDADQVPFVGSYMMSDKSPKSAYRRTQWQKVGDISIGGKSIPLWKRTA